VANAIARFVELPLCRAVLLMGAATIPGHPSHQAPRYWLQLSGTGKGGMGGHARCHPDIVDLTPVRRKFSQSVAPGRGSHTCSGVPYVYMYRGEYVHNQKNEAVTARNRVTAICRTSGIHVQTFAFKRKRRNLPFAFNVRLTLGWRACRVERRRLSLAGCTVQLTLTRTHSSVQQRHPYISHTGVRHIFHA
jgi:hypothetical protein